ncbi:MAG: EamA family transporter [Clostridia bacterium]|nr:EamA family transporter [Clostridia bacterium]
MVALINGEDFPQFKWLLCVMILGFVAYGLSIHFYIMAQKDPGAAKTSAYYSVAPFIGVLFSIILLRERPSIQFYIALLIMIIGTVVMAKDTVVLQHTHEHKHVHTHLHIHNGDSENHTHKHKQTDHQHSHAV